MADDLPERVGDRLRDREETLAVAESLTGGLADRRDITTWGLLYLAGELDADRRRPLPGTRPAGRIRPAWYAGFR